MSEREFEKEVERTLEQLKKTLITKGKEYRRNNNPFHNFDKGAKRTSQIREKVLDGMMLKHEISISDITNDLEEGILPSLEKVNEKFDDNLIYLLIKKVSIIDKLNKNDK